MKLALLVACDLYDNLSRLSYAEKDAADFARGLIRCWGFKRDEIVLMNRTALDEELIVSRENVEEQLRRVGSLGELETFVFGYWGHGLMEGRELYLCAPKSRMDALSEESIAYNGTVLAVTRRLRVDNLCVFLDCCKERAREIDPKDSAKRFETIKKSARGAKRSAALSACQEGETAFEDPENENGIFTGRLLQAQRDLAARDVFSLDAVAEETKRLVVERAVELGRCVQKNGETLPEQTPFYARRGAGDIVFGGSFAPKPAATAKGPANVASFSSRRRESERRGSSVFSFLTSTFFPKRQAAQQALKSEPNRFKEILALLVAQKENYERMARCSHGIEAEGYRLLAREVEKKIEEALRTRDKAMDAAPPSSKTSSALDKVETIETVLEKYNKIKETLGDSGATDLKVETDEKKTSRWILAADEKGNAESADDLPIFYFSGHGLPKEDDETSGWEYACRASVKTSKDKTSDFSNPNPGDRFSLDIEGVETAFRYCPPGEFAMGSPDGFGWASEQPSHNVELTRGFWAAETPTTRALWRVVTGDDPSVFQEGEKPFDDVANPPVENVSWFDFQEFVDKLNALDVAPKGWRFSLPTEAQWEYAARAGSSDSRYGELDEIAWHSGNSELNGARAPRPVGQKKPNAWGLYDAIGDVWEWTADAWTDYSSEPATDPRNEGVRKDDRAIRGGSFADGCELARAAVRDCFAPNERSGRIGGRLVLVPVE